MKNIVILTTILLVGILVITSCEKKEVYLNGFRNFVEEVRRDSPTYTKSEWEKAHANYDRFLDILYYKFGKELTESDRMQISKLKGTYAALRIKGNINQIENSVLEAEYEDEPTLQEEFWNLD